MECSTWVSCSLNTWLCGKKMGSISSRYKYNFVLLPLFLLLLLLLLLLLFLLLEDGVEWDDDWAEDCAERHLRQKYLNRCRMSLYSVW